MENPPTHQDRSRSIGEPPMIAHADGTPPERIPLRRRISRAGSALTALIMMITGLLLAGSPAQADNPIDTDRFVADPSAHVFDGRMYVYATDDPNSGTYWGSKDWRSYSSADGVNWTDHGQVFDLTGFSWAKSLAWAPAAAQRNGFYYLYLPTDRNKIGAARSTSPTSGFSDVRGTPLIDTSRDANTGTEPIDPMTFIDDDGQAYLYFGSSRQPKVVRLNSDMMSTSGPIMNVTPRPAGGPTCLYRRTQVSPPAPHVRTSGTTVGSDRSVHRSPAIAEEEAGAVSYVTPRTANRTAMMSGGPPPDR